MKKSAKKERSPEEQAQHDKEVIERRRHRSLKTRIEAQCSSKGLQAVEYQLEWLKDHPGTELPYSELDHNQTVEAWEAGLSEYKESIKGKVVEYK